MLKEHHLCQWVTGVELFENTAQVARSRLDQVINSSIEEALIQIPDESFDCILCLDVLEHLVDPWVVVNKVTKKLKTNGILITSIPNIRHISILVKLLFLGRWTYADSGILDRTHLRFFTKYSCLELLDLPHLNLEQLNRLISPNLKWLHYLCFGLFDDFISGQYLSRSRKVI
jgi:SAM-dependent methyltransferase